MFGDSGNLSEAFSIAVPEEGNGSRMLLSGENMSGERECYMLNLRTYSND